jgi:hypothetical protein
MLRIKRKRLVLEKVTVRELGRISGGAPRDTEEAASCFGCSVTCQPTVTGTQSYECDRRNPP